MILLLCGSLCADDITPQVVEKQIEDAEAEFREAKKMFNPWYTGPLLAPPASVLPPGQFNVQPYLFMTNNYGQFDKHAHSHHIPHLHQLNPQVVFQFGMFKRVYGGVIAQGLRNKQSGHSSMNWGDTSALLGIGLLKETAYMPALLISIKESFPSGRYQRLHRSVDGMGAGAYQTTLGFNVSKVVWWLTLHPMAFRFAQSWSLPAMVHVSGLNSYGGGPGTHGKVRRGHAYSFDFGYEFSFTQRWVLALDVVYNYAQKTRFSGRTTAAVGGPFSDQLSLAPAIEYNVNENLGFLGGVWLTVWGRNSLNFLSGIVSFTYTF